MGLAKCDDEYAASLQDHPLHGAVHCRNPCDAPASRLHQDQTGQANVSTHQPTRDSSLQAVHAQLPRTVAACWMPAATYRTSAGSQCSARLEPAVLVGTGARAADVDRGTRLAGTMDEEMQIASLHAGRQHVELMRIRHVAIWIPRAAHSRPYKPPTGQALKPWRLRSIRRRNSCMICKYNLSPR